MLIPIIVYSHLTENKISSVSSLQVNVLKFRSMVKNSI